jgi:5-(carboxyamino)imidazole ribonucleotide synthase
MIIGILGGGQLGRMLALSGYPLGLSFKIYSPEKNPCAAQVASHFQADYQDKKKLKEFAKQVDLITYEFENIPVETVDSLKKLVPIFPSSQALLVSQDRLSEKKFFNSLKIPTPNFALIDSQQSLSEQVKVLGRPCVLKTRRMGYDGKGQFVIRAEGDVKKAWQTLSKFSSGLILEQFIPFDREISVLAVRSRNGEIAFYPLVQNIHREGILRTSLAPAPRSKELEKQAHHYAKSILKKLNYVGVLAIEFFVCKNNLIANEMAPRVHNSGHWTIEGAQISQFENHLRAILGLPLGSTGVRGQVKMENIIGKLPKREKILSQKSTHLHLYGKSEAPGRKLGHVTVVK